MEENFISFKTAKLAKKKGFDLYQTFGFETSLYNKIGSHNFYANFGVMFSGLGEGYISAPTQSFLQKWLRENHNLVVWAYPILFTHNGEELERRKFDYFYQIVHKGITQYFSNSRDEYATYELALEAGLEKALTLSYIELKQNKKK